MAATRASPVLLLLLTVQLSLLFRLPDSPSTLALALAAEPEQQNAKQHRQPALLVQSTCNSTSFYDLCIAALAADPASSTADVPGLGAIAVSAAANNASGTAAFLGNASDAAATPQADRARVPRRAGLRLRLRARERRRRVPRGVPHAVPAPAAAAAWGE
uniref:Pectinesterase inhibitor domain-containing protein n=1 Tax=Zea mays TaxID=4577 RepID=A0A804MG90_MAIZE